MNLALHSGKERERKKKEKPATVDWLQTPSSALTRIRRLPAEIMWQSRENVEQHGQPQKPRPRTHSRAHTHTSGTNTAVYVWVHVWERQGEQTIRAQQRQIVSFSDITAHIYTFFTASTWPVLLFKRPLMLSMMSQTIPEVFPQKPWNASQSARLLLYLS